MRWLLIGLLFIANDHTFVFVGTFVLRYQSSVRFPFSDIRMRYGEGCKRLQLLTKLTN